jgi:hypothetical protein
MIVDVNARGNGSISENGHGQWKDGVLVTMVLHGELSKTLVNQ